MRFKAFQDHAHRFWAQIPARFRSGATLMVHREPWPDPEYPEVFLLGLCEPAFAALEDALAWSGDVRLEERQSLVHLYYGSFQAMGERARAFDWIYELEETLLHELTHHWEHRAGLDGLDRFDLAQITNFRRLRGEPVARFFWRGGEPRGPGRWHIDGDLFVEVAEAPPWRVQDAQGQWVTCRPDPQDGFATVPGHGEVFDGERGDLVVAQSPPERPNWLRRLWRRLRGKDGQAPC
ncbi:MAG: metallopeptidase family protein [Myxococcales bacterium]|nr:metallopeptidase family protein [Myxococcales bacterium]